MDFFFLSHINPQRSHLWKILKRVTQGVTLTTPATSTCCQLKSFKSLKRYIVFKLHKRWPNSCSVEI